MHHLKLRNITNPLRNHRGHNKNQYDKQAKAFVLVSPSHKHTPLMLKPIFRLSPHDIFLCHSGSVVKIFDFGNDTHVIAAREAE
jgi:hypothetical protein